MTTPDNMLAALLELPAGLCFLVCGDGTIQAANAEGRKRLGLPRGDPEGTTLQSLAAGDGSDVNGLLLRARGSSGPTFGAVALPDSDGAAVRYRARAVTVNRGKCPGKTTIAVLLDDHAHAVAQFYDLDDLVDQLRSEIVRRTFAEKRLRGALHALETSNDLKSSILAHVSHEFRTPLNAIIGFSEIMERNMIGPLSDRYTEYARDIRTSGEHLLGVVDRILDLSKVEAGVTETHNELMSLGEVLHQCENMVRPMAEDRGVRLRVPRELAVPQLQADIQMIREILLNLMTNAINHAGKYGEVSVRARMLPKSLLIGVADNGAGIAPADKDGLFEPFSRGGDVFTRPANGTGLGLWLVKTFVSAHGGSVRLFSHSNRGTLAAVRLPKDRLAA